MVRRLTLTRNTKMKTIYISHSPFRYRLQAAQLKGKKVRLFRTAVWFRGNAIVHFNTNQKD